MMPRPIKAAFYSVAGPIMRLNGLLYRRFRAPKKGRHLVHLGPGQQNYIEGWINVDANMFTARCDIWANLINPLPFHDQTIDAFYSHHVVEHLPNLKTHFAEVFRCLKPGGIYRVGGPNGDSAIEKFLENEAAWFSNYPDLRVSIGGRFENFIFCRGEHLTILTYSYLEELMLDAGFVAIERYLPVKETGSPAHFDKCLVTEHESDYKTPHTLIVEGRVPK